MSDTELTPREARRAALRGPAGRMNLAEMTDAEKAANQVLSAMDSVNLINDLIATGSRSDEDLDTIDRNVEHLKIVLDRDHVKNSTENLQPLIDTAAAGDAYLAAEA